MRDSFVPKGCQIQGTDTTELQCTIVEGSESIECCEKTCDPILICAMHVGKQTLHIIMIKHFKLELECHNSFNSH